MNLQDRIKEYEQKFQFNLAKKLPVIVRIDGRQFSTFTSGFYKPFDKAITMSMFDVTEYLCRNVQNTKLGYTQSDEITLLLTDWDKDTTDSFFGYKLQKVVSVIQSMATMYFNNCIVEYQQMYNYPHIKQGYAVFDARAFNVPLNEVSNVFIWRQQDAIRNSISAIARYKFGHKQILGKKIDQLKDMLNAANNSWEDYPPYIRYGLCFRKSNETNDWFADLNTPLIFSENKQFITEVLNVNESK